MCENWMKFYIKTVLIIGILHISVGAVSWNKLIGHAQTWSAKAAQDLRQTYQDNSNVNKISAKCNISIWHTLDALTNVDDWAVKMVNAWGTFPPSGLGVGTTTDFGSYDQCLGIAPNSVISKAQYCLIDFGPPLPQPMPVHHNLYHRVDITDLNNQTSEFFKKHSEFASFYYWVSLRTGICVPSKCTTQDIELLADGFATESGLELRKTRCETLKTELSLTWTQVAAITFITIILVITIAVSLYEAMMTKPKDHLLVECFSLKSNVKGLFAKRTSEVFPCIHGIRVCTLFWVVFCHSTEWTNFQLFSRSFAIKEIFGRIDSQLILNGEYAVENFFFIGGMLTSFITFQYTGGRISQFSTIGFIVARWLRLTPQLLIFILITFLLPLIGSGPIWKETISPIIETCSTNWWMNLLYVQNMWRAPQICALHSWFLACDMQFHWISLLLVIPLLYKFKFGLALTGFSIMAFYVASVVIGFLYDLPPGLINTGRDKYFLEYYIDLFYIKPWSHSTVFFIGFFFGIIAYKKKFQKLSKFQRRTTILLIVIGYTVCLLDTYYWTTGRPHDKVLSALVFSSCRLIWSFSTAALIWLCISGNGGFINDFLSSRVMTPLSRVTYSVYLTHVWVIWLFVGTRRERIDTNWTEIGFIFGHNLVIAYLIGFVFAILFEMPVLKMQRRLMKRFIIREDNCKDDHQLELRLRVNSLLKNNNN